MKKIILLTFFLFLYADVKYIINEIVKIEEFKPIFKKIKYYNVFEYETNIVKENIVAVSQKKNLNLKIYAIFQNRVNINGKWFKVGDNIYGYKIVKINKNFVLLKNGNSKKILKILPSSNKLQIK